MYQVFEVVQMMMKVAGRTSRTLTVLAILALLFQLMRNSRPPNKNTTNENIRILAIINTKDDQYPPRWRLPTDRAKAHPYPPPSSLHKDPAAPALKTSKGAPIPTIFTPHLTLSGNQTKYEIPERQKRSEDTERTRINLGEGKRVRGEE